MATALSYRDVYPQRIVGSHSDPFRREKGISTDFVVVIPTFRRREYLKQTLDSVLTQPDVTAMVIVIDDSPEHSAESIVEGYADQPVIYLDTEGYTKYAHDTYLAEKATINRLGLAKT